MTILETETQPLETIGFINRYLKYYLDSSDVVRAICYNVDRKILEVINEQKGKGYSGLSLGTVASLTDCYGKGTMVI